jgi:hypothetical protein
MRFGIIITSLFFLLAIPLTNYTQAYQTELGDDIFIFVQTTIRNSDGQLVLYLESSKFTHLNLEMLGSFLDAETSRTDDPIITIDGKEYQVIRRVTSKIFTSTDLVASTILSDSLDGKITQLVRFAHDGYTVTSGDSLESMWTFIRPVA